MHMNVYWGRIPKYLFILLSPHRIADDTFQTEHGGYSISLFPSVCLFLDSFTVAILDTILAQLSYTLSRQF